MCSKSFRRQPFLVRVLYVGLEWSRHPSGRLLYGAAAVVACSLLLLLFLSRHVQAEAVPGRFVGTMAPIPGIDGGRYLELRDTAWKEGQCYGVIVIPGVFERPWQIGALPCPPSADERALYQSSLRTAGRR